MPVPGHKLIRLRGRGAFATVWEASTPTGEKIALKFMSSANVTTTARELRSLQAIQAIDHPKLLKIREVWSLPGYIVIGMDLADASLLDLIEVYLAELGRPLELPKIIHYLFQVAQGLDFLNSRQHRIDGKLVALQHGDIKPNNILLIGDEAKLADYGLATPMTGSMTPCARHGTAEYCAPEVFHGHLSERSDQFGFAVMYIVMRAHCFPFPAPPTDREKLRNYVRPEPDLSLLPAAEQPILARALSVIPQNRFPTCESLLNAILSVNNLKITLDENGKPIIESSNEQQKSKQFR